VLAGETLSHKAVGSSEQAAIYMPDSCKKSEEGKTSEACLRMLEEGIVVCCTLLTRTEVRVHASDLCTEICPALDCSCSNMGGGSS